MDKINALQIARYLLEKEGHPIIINGTYHGRYYKDELFEIENINQEVGIYYNGNRVLLYIPDDITYFEGIWMDDLEKLFNEVKDRCLSRTRIDKRN